MQLLQAIEEQFKLTVFAGFEQLGDETGGCVTLFLRKGRIRFQDAGNPVQVRVYLRLRPYRVTVSRPRIRRAHTSPYPSGSGVLRLLVRLTATKRSWDSVERTFYDGSCKNLKSVDGIYPCLQE